MKKQTGATVVEFTLVLIFLLTVLLGITDFARMLWTWSAANEATRWGARVSVVCDRDAAAVLARMKSFLPQLEAANVQIDWYTWDKPSSTYIVSTTCDFTNCAGVNVKIVNLNYKWISPIGFSTAALMAMPGFSTFLPREIMGQDPNSNAICS